MRVTAGEAGAKNNVGFAIDDRFEQARVFLRVIFEVGVLDYDRVASGGCDAGAQRSAFALVDFVVDDFGDKRGDLGAKQVAGAVTRAVVYDDDFLVSHGRGANPVHDGADGLGLIVTGYDDGEFHAKR